MLQGDPFATISNNPLLRTTLSPEQVRQRSPQVRRSSSRRDRSSEGCSRSSYETRKLHFEKLALKPRLEGDPWDLMLGGSPLPRRESQRANDPCTVIAGQDSEFMSSTVRSGVEVEERLDTGAGVPASDEKAKISYFTSNFARVSASSSTPTPSRSRFPRQPLPAASSSPVEVATPGDYFSEDSIEVKRKRVLSNLFKTKSSSKPSTEKPSQHAIPVFPNK